MRSSFQNCASVPEVAPRVTLSDDSIDTICARMREWCGVHLDNSKGYLINNRLRTVLHECEVSDFESLIRAADRTSGAKVRDRIVDALTTHETLFFRDRSPYEALAQIVVQELRQKYGAMRPRLRIWSAGCSSGQEPYSIAITLAESLSDLRQWSIKILGTDVSVGTIAQAKTGRFQEHEMRRGVNPEQRRRHFDESGNGWQLKDSIRNMVDFQVGNLTGPNQPTGPFDVIFCRNVLIYFEREDAKRILKNLCERLTPDGRLFVGSSEVLRDTHDLFRAEPIGRAQCFRPLTE